MRCEPVHVGPGYAWNSSNALGGERSRNAYELLSRMPLECVRAGFSGIANL